jgi:hypothetical protein
MGTGVVKAGLLRTNNEGIHPMKTLLVPALGAAMIGLAACGGQGDDTMGDNVADQAEAVAENLEANGMDAQAEAVEEAGEAREEAIDEADVNAAAMNGQ